MWLQNYSTVHILAYKHRKIFLRMPAYSNSLIHSHTKYEILGTRFCDPLEKKINVMCPTAQIYIHLERK